MWVYEKRLQYPVNITQTNAKLAQVIISQFGGPDGELSCLPALSFTALYNARRYDKGTVK